MKTTIALASEAGLSEPKYTSPYWTASDADLDRFAALLRAEWEAERVPASEPVKYLANGTRFKMSFVENTDQFGRDTEGTHVTCFESFENDLDGRWVALVAAEDVRHMELADPPAQPADQPQQLTDKEMWALWNAQGVADMIQHEAIAFARAIEAHHNIRSKE